MRRLYFYSVTVPAIVLALALAKPGLAADRYIQQAAQAPQAAAQVQPSTADYRVAAATPMFRRAPVLSAERQAHVPLTPTGRPARLPLPAVTEQPVPQD